jgi:hypothetical protein
LYDWLLGNLNHWQHDECVNLAIDSNLTWAIGNIQYGNSMRVFGTEIALRDGGEQGRLGLLYGVSVSNVLLSVDFPRRGLESMSVLVDGLHRMESLLEVPAFKGLPVLHCGRVIEQAARLPRPVVSALYHGNKVPEWFCPQRNRERMALQVILNQERPLKTLDEAMCTMVMFGEFRGMGLGELAESQQRKHRYWLNWIDQQDVLDWNMRDSLDVLFEQHPKLQPAKASQRVGR